jgi:PBSX family phage terminase large subunit
MARGQKRLPRRVSETAIDSTEELEFHLHPTQLAFVECDKIYKSFTSGVGAGKSFIGAYDLLCHAQPGALVAVVAPTFRMLSDSSMRLFVEIATKMGLWNENQYRKTDNQAILNNGTEVLFRSGDEPGKLRGPSLQYMWLDECSQMKEDVFNVSIGRLRYGGRQGTLTGTFTPFGKDHWTYRLFGDKTNPNVKLFQCSTKDNPFVTPDFYQNLLLQYGKGEGGALRAQQELDGLFVCVEGAEWGPENFGSDVWFDEWPIDDRSIRVVMLDSSKGIGGKTGDYSCFAIVMYSGGKLWVEFDMDNVRNASGMAKRAIEIQKWFKPDYFGVESEFGGTVLVDDLSNRAEAEKILMPLVLVPTGGIQKEVRIRKLTPYLTQGMIRFRNTEDTKIGVAQMESFPHAEHDDGPDALEGAIRIINESGIV